MFAHPSRRLGISVAALAILCITQSYPVRADPDLPLCDYRKAVKKGCPVPQIDCRDEGCDNVFCESSDCYTTTKVQESDYFGCSEISFGDESLYGGKWLCYQEFTNGPFGLQPVVRWCLEVFWCVETMAGCFADQQNPGIKGEFIYGTSHDCIKP